jgi:hypothetical protein
MDSSANDTEIQPAYSFAICRVVGAIDLPQTQHRFWSARPRPRFGMTPDITLHESGHGVAALHRQVMPLDRCCCSLRSIRKFSRRTFSGCTAEAVNTILFSNGRIFVFDLSVVNLHHLIAPHIITKFLA